MWVCWLSRFNTTMKYLDFILDNIIKISDYFLIEKYITLSESILFFAALTRAIWFSAFGVQMYSLPSNNDIWIPVFLTVSIVHFATFFLSNLWYRSLALIFHAFIWCLLAILSATHNPQSPAFPTFIILALTAVFIAVRIRRQ